MKKEIYLPYFKDKKVTILGLGLLGRGMGDTLFVAENQADIICTDTRSREKLAESIKKVESHNFKNLQLIIGEIRLIDFENRDYILTCAGMPKDYEYLMHARKNGIPIYMSAALVVSIVYKHLPNVKVIGVTGTRGKTTTTALIAHILHTAGKTVHLGGNIRGIANLPILEKIEDGDYLVLELDSWQLQGFGEFKISPNIAVFTSFMDDHMNYYKDDRRAYFLDKANIYKYQKEGDILIGSNQAKEEISKYDLEVEVSIPTSDILEMNLIGKHNQISARLAYEVGIKCGIDESNIKESIKNFKAVEGRLEDMGLFRGVRVFNDNNATTPDATIAAIKSIYEKYNKKPILILGGGDKNLPLDHLEEVIKEDVQDFVLLEGAGTERLKLDRKYIYERLEDCIDQAFKLAQVGDIILFSPTFVSFSKYFNNEYERNDLFVKEVQKYA
ncbi:MAG: UDP-N-acetylmuramoylalanine--D-glutamate ligase [Candidatus Nomurabacteria bacterium]|nr:UDP-N-acetylmuramoylalanine--D-glutamate ligase [Candidatus Nomurabacteria bacterium]